MPEPTDEERAAAEAKAKADADAAEAKAKADAAAAADKKFTQADLDRIAGESRASGRTKAEEELLKTLGVTDLDAAKATLAAAREAEDAKKTEAEKLTEERDQAKAEAEQARSDATRLLAITKLELGLRDSGIKPERIPAAMKLVDLSGLKVDGIEVTGIPEAIEAVKGDSPEWFGPSKPGSPDASGGGGGGAVDFRSASRTELAAEMKRRGLKL